MPLVAFLAEHFHIRWGDHGLEKSPKSEILLIG